MDVTIYSIQSAVQAYGKQNRLAVGPRESSVSVNPAAFKDKVTLSSEGLSEAKDFQQFIYRKEDIIDGGTKVDK